ncbi:aminopeptidase N-like isoform X1 [Leguminivora glycinivorella]|uniref:aminopeptidase N-like isoform X1 n=1 Tax=Leguminivora glycinivorella TaxID=1035111 RepID=UPI00200C0816|nr:aminopeptidase N-like isoform X1 [Leguminivora glycinivorella]
MRTLFVFCFVLGVVSSLPIKIEEESDLPIPQEVPDLPVPDLPEDNIIEHVSDYPTLPELPLLEEEIDGVDPNIPIHPGVSMPILDTPENPEVVQTDLFENGIDENELNDPNSPDNIPIMIENGIEEGNDILMRNQIRPGMHVTSYLVELTPNAAGGTFSGLLTASVIISDASSLEDDIVFHVEDLNINSVRFSITGSSAIVVANFDVNDDLLEIDTGFETSLYTFFIEYTGSMTNTGTGFWHGEFDSSDYYAMNLHATNARRVFPCMDELTEPSTISFTFNNIPYNNIFMNSAQEDNTNGQFKALLGPAVLWGMVAHNFNNINNPAAGVQLYARPGVINQENQASVAINSYFNNMELWTQKPYNEIVLDQDGRMLVIALPDVHKDWYALSTVCIWEPYILMERVSSTKQRKEALAEISIAIARQWYGYVIYPENWRFQWVIQGLASYTGYELNKEFQSNQLLDVTLVDFNTVFVSDVIQEALYRDGYVIARPLEPEANIFDEDEVRDHISGLDILKYKSPALMNMLKLILGNQEQDFIRTAGQILLNSRALETVNSRFFIDAINAEWLTSGNRIVDDLSEFLEPWLQSNGYPILHVGLRQGGVLLTQEKFGFTATDQVNYQIPVTWTSSINPNYEINDIRVMDNTMTINVVLNDDDYVLFNIQGQGYYRVNYDLALWERIIEALEDPDEREQIHPLNRATLIDDALNLARAGMLDYDIAFKVVLTMEHEINYAPWKAFVRNMDFLQKRLLAMVEVDDDLDQDIYLRMVRRTAGKVENEIGFYPDISVTEDSDVAMTRGLVMEHACKARYAPCIAAAVDWFWDPNDRDVVNPNIPHEIRPAVYCTMVREGGNDIINALYARLEIEPTMYERVVILESLACSQDSDFISTYLAETLASNGPYSTEERTRIFKAVVSASTDNADTAVNFISRNTANLRRMYGGDEKLEEIIWHIAECLAGDSLSTDYIIWANSINSDLDNSEMAAQRAKQMIEENLSWERQHLDYVYEWIDENDAPTLVVSMVLIFGSFLLTIFNH